MESYCVALHVLLIEQFILYVQRSERSVFSTEAHNAPLCFYRVLIRNFAAPRCPPHAPQWARAARCVIYSHQQGWRQLLDFLGASDS